MTPHSSASTPISKRRSRILPFFGKATLSALLLSSGLSPVRAATTLKVSDELLAPDSKMEIVFDHAVVADDQLNRPLDNTLLLSQPKLPGKLVWTAANIAYFHPETAPKMDTLYRFSIAQGARFLSGDPIPAIPLQRIKSEAFQLLGSSRRSDSIKITRQPVYYLYFNDHVDPTQAADSIHFADKEGARIAAQTRRATWKDIQSRYRIGHTWEQRFQLAREGKKVSRTTLQDDDPIPNALVVSPVSALPLGDDWNIVLSQSLSPTKRPQTQLNATSVHIGNIDPFELVKARATISANEPRQIILNFNYPIQAELSPQQLEQWIQITPPLEQAQYRIDENAVIIEGNLRQQDRWEVSLKARPYAVNGLSLKPGKKQTLTFKTLRSALALPSYDSAQYAHGNRLYGIDTVNIASLRIRVKQLSAEKAVRTMQGYQHYKGSGHNHKELNPAHPMPYALIDGATVYDRTIHLDNPIDTSKEVSLDWNAVLPKNDRTAIFFVSVEGTAKDKARGGSRIAQSFIQLTDIGLCWKLNKQEALIYAFSCATGKPIPGLQLQTYQEDAQKAGSSQTDARGIARIPRDPSARHLRASHGNDHYIIPFDNTLDTVALWRFPVDVEWNHLEGWKQSSMMFTDRNLYRPGETVHIKGIVRQFLDNQVKLPADTSAQLSISDSASRVLFDETITLSQLGTFDHSFKLPAETVGRFLIELTLPVNPAQAKEDSWLLDRYSISQHSINVQEFRRNAFEIQSDIPAIKPGERDFSLNLAANYYQGQAVKNGLVSWNMSARQSGFYPEDFRDFLFGDHRRYDSYYWSHYFGYGSTYGRGEHANRNGQTQLDADGKTQISFTVPETSFPIPLEVNIHSEITDSRDQTLSRANAITVHPADTYIGISRNDRLCRVGEKIDTQLVAVDTQGKARTQAITVSATIEREYNQSVKILSTDGKAKVENKLLRETVLESEITITPGPSTPLPFTPSQSGRHIITLKGTDTQGRAFASASRIYVYGSNDYPWATEDGMKIKLVPEQTVYHPGDTARILVMTPIEGTALVTVERAGVHRVYRRELKADHPVIELPLTDQDAPNAVVSVIVIRGAEASPHQHKTPAMKLGYCTLNITNTKDRLTVDLKVQGSQHRPGEPTTINGSVTRADGSPAAGAEVVLYAEDEGTLAVAGYDNPDPMKTFHAHRPLLVRCGTSFSTFLDENVEHRYFGNKGFTIGGGGPETGSYGSTLLKSRSNFNPCAVWKPTLLTNARGEFSCTFTNPDTLTRYRVIAVAIHGEQRFGHNSSQYTVDKPLMLTPTPPRFASEGDQLQVKTLVQNNSEFEAVWQVSLATSSLTRAHNNSPLSKTISLKPGDSADLYFDVHFTGTGKTHWTWTATPVSLATGKPLTEQLRVKLSDQAEARFEVTYPVPLMRQFQWVTLREDKQVDLLEALDPALLEGRGYLELTASNSLLLKAGEAIDFLLGYPYGCLEQTTSSLMPWFAVRDLQSLVPGFKNTKEEEIQAAIQTGADRLLTMQTRSGGLAYWPGGKDPEVWCSAYGGMGLLLARKQGARVPESAIQQLCNWLQTSLNSEEKSAKTLSQQSSWELETRARALYVLALANQAQVDEHNQLLDHTERLSSTAKAFLALAMHHAGAQQDSIIALLNSPAAGNSRAHWMPHRPDHAMNLLAWSQIAPDSDAPHKAMKDLIASRNPYGHWRTTWCNAWALQAIASYARHVEVNRQPSTLRFVTHEGEQTISLDQKNPTHSWRIPLVKGLKLSVDSKQIAHINLRLSAKPEVAPAGPKGFNGLALTRRYEQLLPDGSVVPMEQPRVGDLIKVNLDISFAGSMQYVVIEDRLPSLFEAVNQEFDSQSAAFGNRHATSNWLSHKELRSDRAVFFLNAYQGSGKRTISYLARVTAAGSAAAPAAKIEAMYEPQQVALSDSQRLTTREKPAVAGP